MKRQLFTLVTSILYAIKVAAVITLLTPLVSVAESASESVYLIDMQRLLNESIAGKAARSTLEAEAKKRQASLVATKNELDKLKEEIQKQASVLSANALDDKRATLEKKARDFEASVQAQRDELGRQNSAEIEKIVQQINAVIKEVAEKESYKFILEKDERLVLYADKRLDLTDRVLKILDSKKVGL